MRKTKWMDHLSPGSTRSIEVPGYLVTSRLQDSGSPAEQPELEITELLEDQLQTQLQTHNQKHWKFLFEENWGILYCYLNSTNKNNKNKDYRQVFRGYDLALFCTWLQITTKRNIVKSYFSCLGLVGAVVNKVDIWYLDIQEGSAAQVFLWIFVGDTAIIA